MLPPGLLEVRPHFAADHEVGDLLEAGVGRGLGLEGQLVVCRGLEEAAAGGDLPEDEAARVHVDAEEGVAVESDGALEYLWRHVAASAHLKLQ